MRDVSDELVPHGDGTIPADQHVDFVDHLAGFCAATWDWQDDPVSGLGLLPYAARWTWFDHYAIEGERGLGWLEPVPRVAEDGWHRFARWRRPTSPVSSTNCGGT